MKRKKLKSDIVLVEPDRITMHGLDLCADILGKINLGDMAFLQLQRRMPTPQESTVFNAIAVTLVEHGMTPSAIVARMTYAGSPEAMQAAIAAGLCGMGSTMVGAMENAARMLQEAIPDRNARVDVDALARKIINKYADCGETIRGIGHHFHKPIDPRAPRLFEIARANGFDGPYVKLMQAISKVAAETSAESTAVNAPGAIGAIASELGLPWEIVRGIGSMSRTIGLIAHISEEIRDPMTREIQFRVEEEATAHLRGDRKYPL
jgi:citrate synthase